MQAGTPHFEEPQREGDLAGKVHEVLGRILAAVEKDRPQSRFELALVILLSLTALGSTWCAYQSQLWNGVQLVRLADADAATQDAHELALAGQGRRILDGLVFLSFMEAHQRNDTQMAEAIHRRMKSPAREAVDAWLKLDPLNNPNAPGPGQMPQYVLPEVQEAQRQRDAAGKLRAQAQAAGSSGDTYVLLTLMFASVLFFGGIAGTFRSRRVRLSLGGIACVLFVVTALGLATMPVCKG